MFRNDNGQKRTDYIPLSSSSFDCERCRLYRSSPFLQISPHVSWILHIVGVVGVTVLSWAHRYMNFENFIVISALNLLTTCHHVNFKTLLSSIDLAFKENMSFWVISLRPLLRRQCMGGTSFWIVACWKSLCFFCNIWALWWKK